MDLEICDYYKQNLQLAKPRGNVHVIHLNSLYHHFLKYSDKNDLAQNRETNPFNWSRSLLVISTNINLKLAIGLKEVDLSLYSNIGNVS